MNPNREIYNRNYSNKNVALNPTNNYERNFIAMRQGYIEKYGYGRDVLDLCCGSGSYLIPALPHVKRAIGIDFSANMLDAFRANAGAQPPANLTLLEEDASHLSLPDACVDFVFSYTALYYVPRLDQALVEASRVLRKGGYAVFELGNSHSINTLVCKVFHEQYGWAKPYYVPYADLRRFVREAGFEVVEWRSFQLLNNYGVPPRLFWLYPLASPLWKHLLGFEVGGKMLDEWLSSAGPLRSIAFRHLVVVRKP
jgi:ubiquinone/menaquinone biosynthesis C-methylase UbiE